MIWSRAGTRPPSDTIWDSKEIYALNDLMFILQGTVDIDFRTTYYKISRGLQPLTLPEAALARKAKVMAIKFLYAKDMALSRPRTARYVFK